MKTCFGRWIALVFVALASMPIQAALAPQPFVAPPQLLENKPPQNAAMLKQAAAAPSPCVPSGDITRDGQNVILNLQVQQRENAIYNPGNPDGAKDRVMLRSYGGCLSGPLLDLSPGITLRVHLDNQASAEGA